MLQIRDLILISLDQTVEARLVWLSSEEINLSLQMLVILDVYYQGRARYFHSSTYCSYLHILYF